MFKFVLIPLGFIVIGSITTLAVVGKNLSPVCNAHAMYVQTTEVGKNINVLKFWD